MKKTRMHEAAIARKPKTTMTAIAQWGKDDDDDEACWTFPVDEASAADTELSELEAARADDDEEAAAALDEDATESRTVVWTAEKIAWLIWLPSRVLSLRIITQ